MANPALSRALKHAMRIASFALMIFIAATLAQSSLEYYLTQPLFAAASVYFISDNNMRSWFAWYAIHLIYVAPSLLMAGVIFALTFVYALHRELRRE